MPILAKPKHEAFAQALAAGVTAEEAYVAAGNKRHRGNAWRLSTNEDIQARVAEIRERAAAGLVITQQWLLERAEEARKGAMDAGQHAAAVSAIKELGILSGHRVEKREHLSRGLEQMSDDELMRIARGEASTCH